jgi:hypothetical protein
LPHLAELAPHRWHTIRPGGETACLYGTEYGFFVRPEDPARVLITFPGGGSCWSGLTCSDEPQGRMDDNPKTVKAEDSPESTEGVFAEGNAENPFLEFTKIHVGYCTGDMHIGDAVRPNDGWLGVGAPPSETLSFKGFTNAMTVLDWLYANFEHPRTVVVVGVTSGSYATPFYASLIADRYADAAVRHLGDGNGALFVGDKLRPLLEAWDTLRILRQHAGFEALAGNGFTFEDVTIAAGQRHPDIVFTQMVTAHDQVFSELIAYLGVAEPMLSVIEAGQRHVKERIGNYRTFLAGGNKHLISLGYFDAVPQTGNRNRGWPDIYDRFYRYQVQGRRYRDWVDDVVAGRPVEDVRCSDCSRPEYFAER